MSVSPGSTTLDGIIGEIYLAASEPERWPLVLAAICAADAASDAGLLWSPLVESGGLRCGHNLRHPVLGLFAEAVRRGGRAEEMNSLAMRLGGMAADIANSDIAGAPVRGAGSCDETVETLGAKADESRIALVFGEMAEELTVFALFGTAWPPSVVERKRRLLDAIAPHFQVALRNHWRLGRVERRLAGVNAAFDAITLAMFWLDPSGKLLEANSAAIELLASGDPLILAAGHLRTASGRDNDRLFAFIRRAAAVACTEAEMPGAGNPLTGFIVAPVATRSALNLFALPNYGASPRVLLCAVAAGDLSRGVAPGLSRLFGLAPSEAKIAAAIATGMSIEEVAEQRGRSLATVRSQVKHLMAKMGVARQADLVRLAAAVGAVTGDPRCASTAARAGTDPTEVRGHFL